MGTVEDEATAYLFTIACSTSAADHTQSDESFEFTYRAIESGKFQMFGRHVADPT
jgi:hypothetical protein